MLQSELQVWDLAKNVEDPVLRCGVASQDGLPVCDAAVSVYESRFEGRHPYITLVDDSGGVQLHVLKKAFGCVGGDETPIRIFIFLSVLFLFCPAFLSFLCFVLILLIRFSLGDETSALGDFYATCPNPAVPEVSKTGKRNGGRKTNAVESKASSSAPVEEKEDEEAVEAKEDDTSGAEDKEDQEEEE